MKDRRSVALAYGLPLAATSICTLLKLSFPHALGAAVPFLLYEAAIAFCGWRCGARSAVVALLSGVLFAWYFFLPVERSFGLEDYRAVVQLGVFVCDGALVTLIVALLHRSQRSTRAIAEEQRRALQESEAAQRRLALLAEVNTALSRALTSQDISDAVLDLGTRLAGADTCTLYALDSSGDELELLGARGVHQDLLARIRRLNAASDSPAFRSIRTGELIWAENEADYVRLYPALASQKSARAKAFWSIPLVVEGRAHGLLGMGFHAPRRFPPEEREFIIAFSLNCAQALRRAQLFEQAQAARQQTERSRLALETTLRSIGDGVIATDTQARITFMNPVAEQLTGWSASEAEGRLLESVFRIVNEHSRREVENPARRVLQTGGVVGLANHTVLLGREPGQETPIDDSGAPIRSEDGEVFGVVLVFRDVSAQKLVEKRREFLTQALEALSSSLEYTETLSRVAELCVPKLADWCAIDMLDRERNVLKRVAVAHIDPEKVQLALELGRRYPADLSAPRGVAKVLRTGKSEFFPRVTPEQVEAGARDPEHLAILRELRLRSAISAPIAVRGRVLGVLTLIYAESGRNYDAEDLAFAEDFARRAATAVENARLYLMEQESRAEADAANKAKDEFLATVSHELRTPLNAILGWSRMLNGMPLDEARSRKALGAIERGAVAMTQLIEDLLDVSRIVSGRMRVELKPVEIAPIVESAIESIRPTCEVKQLTIEPLLEPGSGRVLGDEARLSQIISNLLTNAAKFTPQGGSIRVRLAREASHVELIVSDSGRGISAEMLPHIFAPFRQADGSITRPQGGLGLGLAIVRHLVELHRGSVVAESPGEGKGSTFRVRLPALEHDLSARKLAEVYPSTSDWPSLQALHVLVVEDDPDTRELLCAVLEQCGCRVSSAGTAAAALAAIEREVPSLLLSDIGLPELDGYELIKRLRSSPDTRHRSLPAIAITAYARSEDRWKALRAGFLMHIPKPIEPGEVVAAVANLVGARLS